MKEFEKWDKKVKVKTWSGNMMERRERKWYREQTWRAALEMVRDYMIEQEPNAPYFDYVLLDKIEKELEDEN